MTRTGRIYWNILLISMLGLVSACQPEGHVPSQMKVGKPYVIDGKSYYPQYDEHYDHTGEASWYGPGFHGKYTADGETFDQNDLTAAHPTLPMPCIVRVTNLENGKSLLVRINDRGPFKSNRIIDLSKHSAEKLGALSLTRVRVQFLPQESAAFLDSVHNGHPLSMADMNSNPLPPQQIVETSVVTTSNANPVSDAAPVTTVNSIDIAGSVPAETTTVTTTTIVNEAPDTSSTEEQAEPVVQSDLIAPVAPSTSTHTLQNPNAPAKPVQLTRNWANDNVSLPEPAQAQPAAEAETTTDDADTDANNEPAPAPAAAPITRAAPVNAAPVSSKNGHYIILAGAFASKENADKLIAKLSDVAAGSVAPVNVGGKSLWRVHIGPFDDEQTASDVLQQVRADGAPDARISHQ